MYINYKDVDFHSLLLKMYRYYDLDIIDVMVIFIADELIKEGEKTITIDCIRPFFPKKVSQSDVDYSLVKLINKRIIIISDDFSCSIDKFKKTLFEDALKDSYLDMYSSNDTKDNLFSIIEKNINRKLTISQRESVTNYLREGYLEDDIIEAFKESIIDDGYVSNSRVKDYLEGKKR